MGHLYFLHRDRYIRVEENEFRVESANHITGFLISNLT